MPQNVCVSRNTYNNVLFFSEAPTSAVFILCVLGGPATTTPIRVAVHSHLLERTIVAVTPLSIGVSET